MTRTLGTVPLKGPASFTPAPFLRLQRACACGGRCESCRNGEATMQRSVQRVPSIVGDVLRSQGQALDVGARATLEPRFGHDFSRVRVHTDARAAESTRSIDAVAYTVGRDIVFGAGQYAPGTSEGQRLLAHELTHVVQQAVSPASGALTLGQAGDALEREADHIADRVSMAPASGEGMAPALSRSTSPTVQRQQPIQTDAAAQKEARLRRLATFPGEALTAWKGLSQADRDSILMQMVDRYGVDFASDFLQYAKGAKKPNISATVTNSPDITPKWLKDHGYRLAGSSGGVPKWVHPSGHEYWLMPAAKPAPEPDKPDDRQERCADPCMGSTDDEDACHKCCDDTIPADDDPCRRTCHVTCDMKL